MRLGDLIQSLTRADHLDRAYKTRACLRMSYPAQACKLPAQPVATSPLPEDLSDTEFEDALRSSGLMAMVEHLYPHGTSQRQ